MQGVLVRNSEINNHLGNIDVDGSITLKRILNNRILRHGMNSYSSIYGQMAASCGDGVEYLGAIKQRKFLTIRGTTFYTLWSQSASHSASQLINQSIIQ